MLADRADADLADVTLSSLTFATAWLLGDGARSRRLAAAQAEERAASLERTRAAEARQAVVEERNRIAREMHDVLAHSVSMMVVQAEAGPVVVERDPDRAVQAFDAISATGKAALTELRRLLGVLREDGAGPLAPQPGLAAAAGAGGGRPGRRRGRRVDAARPGAAAPGARPRRLPDRAGGADQRGEARRTGPRRPARWRSRGDRVRVDVADDGLGGARRRRATGAAWSACASGRPPSAAR